MPHFPNKLQQQILQRPPDKTHSDQKDVSWEDWQSAFTVMPRGLGNFSYLFGAAAAAAAKSLQSCLTLCNPIDGSPPGSSVHGIFQARVLQWGAIAFSTLWC